MPGCDFDVSMHLHLVPSGHSCSMVGECYRADNFYENLLSHPVDSDLKWYPPFEQSGPGFANQPSV